MAAPDACGLGRDGGRGRALARDGGCGGRTMQGAVQDDVDLGVGGVGAAAAVSYPPDGVGERGRRQQDNHGRRRRRQHAAIVR